MDVFYKIAEGRIQEAIGEGVFDNLPGKGKPLKLEDLSGVPPELRICYKILKNAGILPNELQLKKEMITLRGLINCCYDEEEKIVLIRKLNEKTLRFNMLMEKRNIKQSVFNAYEAKIHKKLGI